MPRTLISVLVMGLAGLAAWAQETAPVAGSRPAAPPQPDLWKLLSDCEAKYQKVNDYTATFRKQERIAGKLMPVHLMSLEFRKPLSVHLVWRDGSFKDCEALYVAGRYDGKLLVYLGHLGSFRKVMKLDPQGVEALRGSSHPIGEAGVGHLLERMVEQFENARAAGTLRTEDLTQEEIDGRKTWRVMRVLEDGGRRVWNVDQELMFPTRVITRDKEGQLVESFAYTDVKVNPGLRDEDFDPDVLW